MIEWAECFDAQIFLHSADREWVMRKSPRIRFWEGPTLSLWDGLTLINCGGHFEGGTVLHWPTGANGKGALLTGDIITVVQDRRYVSFLRSYPNLIPLGPRRSAASSKGSNHSHSSRFTAAGGRRTFSRMPKQPLRDPPNGICAAISCRYSGFQTRREDACALPKLAQNRASERTISHEVLLECDGSSHRFHFS